MCLFINKQIYRANQHILPLCSFDNVGMNNFVFCPRWPYILKINKKSPKAWESANFVSKFWLLIYCPVFFSKDVWELFYLYQIPSAFVVRPLRNFISGRICCPSNCGVWRIWWEREKGEMDGWVMAILVTSHPSETSRHVINKNIARHKQIRKWQLGWSSGKIRPSARL